MQPQYTLINKNIHTIVFCCFIITIHFDSFNDKRMTLLPDGFIIQIL